ncbi:MAG: hypothetical protein ABSG59_22400 [Verrucomicrobiota bacterium]|jgi:hypothetical protein
MKVAYFAESPADEAALKILTEGVLGNEKRSYAAGGGAFHFLGLSFLILILILLRIRTLEGGRD